MKVLTVVLNFFKKFWLELLIIVVMIVVDQVTKAAIVANIRYGDSVVLIPKFLNFTYTLNDGAGFGILRGQTWFFILTSSLATVGFCIYLFYRKVTNKLFVISMPLIVAGTVGNLIDRVFNDGLVRDFVEIEYFGLEIFGYKSFAIFNVADACLVVGVIVFAVYLLFFYSDKKPKGIEGASVAPLGRTQQAQEDASTISHEDVSTKPLAGKSVSDEDAE